MIILTKISRDLAATYWAMFDADWLTLPEIDRRSRRDVRDAQPHLVTLLRLGIAEVGRAGGRYRLKYNPAPDPHRFAMRLGCLA